MDITRALRLQNDICLALVGAGGKTTTMFRVARELRCPVILSASTHLGINQVEYADSHVVVDDDFDIKQAVIKEGVNLFTAGLFDHERFSGLSDSCLFALYQIAKRKNIPFIIEADGSRRLPIKAPADHEPAIPKWIKQVVVIAGLSYLEKPLSDETVFRAKIFGRLAEMEFGGAISLDAIKKVMLNPMGGLKNIPPEAKRFVYLNQAPLDIGISGDFGDLLQHYDSVLIKAKEEEYQKTGIDLACEQVAGIVLAAGDSSRLGRPKALLEWRGKPLIWHVVNNALEAGFSPVKVILGAVIEPIMEVLAEFPVEFVLNENWIQGQSQSVKLGLESLSKKTGAAAFFLCDQPQIGVEHLRQLIIRHRETLSPAIVPYVGEQRANPVLFDKSVFEKLLQISGDRGGRAILDSLDIEKIVWQDERLLIDVDTEEDYKLLLSIA